MTNITGTSPLISLVHEAMEEVQAGIKKQVENKVRMIMEQPLTMGEPLKGNFRGGNAIHTLDHDIRHQTGQ